MSHVKASNVPVLIAGGGPVGLMLSAELTWRGIDSLLVEPQIEINKHPRAISIGVRSMEHFRRIGIDQNVIDAGVPRSHPLDVVYCTRMLGEELYRFRIPSIDDLELRRAELEPSIKELAASPYYKTWTAQSPLERVLRRHLASAGARVRFGWRLESFSQDAEGVSAEISEVSGPGRETVRTDFLAGCDGSSSRVRNGLGIPFRGKGVLGTARGVYFRAPYLRSLLEKKGTPGVMYWTLAPGAIGVIYTIDGGDEWVFNRYYAPNETGAGDDVELLRAALGADTEFEILSALDWKPQQLVTDSFASGRTFLAGDACHLFVPTGGLGMNTGIGDVVDLAWKLEAVLKGWGGTGLLSSYDAERRPIGSQNTLEAADNYFKSQEMFADLGAIEAPTPEGLETRARLQRSLPPKIKHFAPIGIHLGYRYENSPIIVPDTGKVAPRSAATYTPCSAPGHRAPHVWLDDGRSTLDLFGRGFVVLAVGRPGRAAEPLMAAASKKGMPLAVTEVDHAESRSVYGQGYFLVRPDGHVAWRSAEVPQDAGEILDVVRGASSVSPTATAANAAALR